jgi:hypothetical protein
MSGPEPAVRASSDGHDERLPARTEDGFTDPVIYGRRHRGLRPRPAAWALALILFAAAPVALLIAVLH